MKQLGRDRNPETLEYLGLQGSDHAPGYQASGHGFGTPGLRFASNLGV